METFESKLYILSGVTPRLWICSKYAILMMYLIMWRKNILLKCDTTLGDDWTDVFIVSAGAIRKLRLVTNHLGIAYSKNWLNIKIFITWVSQRFFFLLQALNNFQVETNKYFGNTKTKVFPELNSFQDNYI